MRTLLSANFHYIFSYRWLTKCLQYKTATCSTYKINVSNSKFVILFHSHRTPSRDRKTNYQRYMTLQTLKNYAWNSYVAYKKCYCEGGWGVGTIDRCYKYLDTHTHTVCTSTIHHMKTYEAHKYWKSSKMYFHYLIWMKLPKHKITSVHSRKNFWNSLQTDRHTTFVNSDDSKYNAP
jgi:hypothetical protein